MSALKSIICSILGIIVFIPMNIIVLLHAILEGIMEVIDNTNKIGKYLCRIFAVLVSLYLILDFSNTSKSVKGIMIDNTINSMADIGDDITICVVGIFLAWGVLVIIFRKIIEIISIVLDIIEEKIYEVFQKLHETALISCTQNKWFINCYYKG